MLCALLAMLVWAGAAAAGPAGIDTGWGDAGIAKVTPPFGKETGFYFSARQFAAAPDGGAYVFGQAAGRGYLERFGPAGTRDGRFGGSGVVTVGNPGHPHGLLADGASRVLVGELEGAELAIRRFTIAGKLDPSFGGTGIVGLRCGCEGSWVRLLRAPRGRIFVVAFRRIGKGAPAGPGTAVTIARLRSDGRLDPGFGKGGVAHLVLRHPGEPRVVTAGPAGEVLFGGSKAGGPREIWLERVTPRGRLDRAFGRTARHSALRLSVLGEFPTLAAVVPRADGGLEAIGTSENRSGFQLRVDRNGRLARSFGKRGLMRLPFTVDSAVPGIHGAIFVVGEAKVYSGYDAFRILADGRLDPAYGGAQGIEIPVYGVRAHAASQGRGRVLVTDNGNVWCRSGCAAEPSMVRFRE
jgi:uncharacterized delta-60 repeat protein